MNDLNNQADARPDWADQTRGQCQTCRDWPKLTKAGLTVKHMRSEPGRWHKVPCEGSGTPPLPARAGARLAAGTEDPYEGYGPCFCLGCIGSGPCEHAAGTEEG